ncbi:hypothetical protein VTL71DRAFT_8297 [Oculimacula yallundae]|uniref:Transmembrane protein n=1 Tax=Oculimacula yallundae TaxID=86028 RepID=A0ABR4CX79_9HELO
MLETRDTKRTNTTFTTDFLHKQKVRIGRLQRQAGFCVLFSTFLGVGWHMGGETGNRERRLGLALVASCGVYMRLRCARGLLLLRAMLRVTFLSTVCLSV